MVILRGLPWSGWESKPFEPGLDVPDVSAVIHFQVCRVKLWIMHHFGWHCPTDLMDQHYQNYQHYSTQRIDDWYSLVIIIYYNIMYDIDDFIQKMHHFGLLWVHSHPKFHPQLLISHDRKAPCSPMFLGKKQWSLLWMFASINLLTLDYHSWWCNPHFDIFWMVRYGWTPKFGYLMGISNFQTCPCLVLICSIISIWICLMV